MLRSFKIILFVVAVTTVTLNSCRRNRAPEIPIADFFKVPEKSGFRISPDGEHVSYSKPGKGRKQNLFIASISDLMNNTGKESFAASYDNQLGRDYSWTYDNQIVFIQNNPVTKESKIMALDVATLKLREMLNEKKAAVRILNSNRKTPDVITIEMNKRDSTSFDIYRLNIKTGELKTYLVNPGNVIEWYPDSEGKILLEKASDGVDETILYRPTENVAFRAIIKNNFKESVTPIAFTTIKNYFYALSNVGRDKTVLVMVNAETGKEEKTVYSSDNADILTVRYSTNKRRLDYVAWQEAKPHKYFLNGDAERIDRSLRRHPELRGNELNITSTDTAEDKFIVRTFTDRNPGSVYLYESKTDKLDHLSDNSTIDPDVLCAMKPISYKATDGMPINGYLTLPHGDSTGLPVIVMPHDGPFGNFNRDSWSYNSDVQFLANRGYAVLQVNYRGSTGYGKAFYNAGFKEVGGKIQQDITDGVDWLIANKIADPKKVAIFGRGFGGFSALYGVSFHQNRYSCAIVQNPLLDFFAYIKDVPPFLKPFVQRVYEQVGDPGKEADQLRAISPVFHSDKIKAPLLIFQNPKDPRANMSELYQFIRQLQKRKVPVITIIKSDDRGSFRRTNNRVETYTEIEKFLDKYLKGKR